MEPIPGLMMRYSKEDKNLLAFISLNKTNAVCSNAVILIPGLGDGIMSMAYSTSLHFSLSQIDYSLIQVNISSSFNQFGFNDLKRDISELQELIQFLKVKYNFNRIFLLGHSTGCQDVLYYMRYGTNQSLVNGVILQGAVSDRDGLMMEESTPSMIKESKELVLQGKPDAILSQRLYDAPITANRFLSLAGRLTPDDMFSIDLTDDELIPILSPVRVPTLLCFSEGDEYVPDKVGQRQLADRMVRILKMTSPHVELLYVPDADHGLTVNYDIFVDTVIKFIETPSIDV
jgi:pimeloyl-ACP methyl ester carboxylesterase